VSLVLLMSALRLRPVLQNLLRNLFSKAHLLRVLHSKQLRKGSSKHSPNRLNHKKNNATHLLMMLASEK
jgi:hypothetical protein